MSKSSRIFSLVPLGVSAVLAFSLLSTDVSSRANRARNAAQDGPASKALEQYVVTKSGTGCNAQGCHGNQTPGDKSVQQNEQTYVDDYDKHAEAYAMLKSDRAKQMAANLAPSNPDQKLIEAHNDTRCLACHALPESAIADPSRHVELIRAEGVNCQACHGPAQLQGLKGDPWYTAHTEGDKDYKELASAGMTQINNLVVQPETCAGCHVGAPGVAAKDNYGMVRPARDLNHDLMAAGHPRLTFDLSTYRMNQPPHWRLKGREDKIDQEAVDYEATVWAVGQVASLKAQVVLTKHRVEQSKADKAPWPEFAEANCFACHANFELGKEVDGVYRRAQAGEGYYGKRLPGAPPYNNWYGFMIEPLAASGVWPAPAGTLEAYNELMALMSTLSPEADEVIAKATALEAKLTEWLAKAPTGDKPVSAKRLLGEVRDFAQKQTEKIQDLTWDETMQIALALTALKTDAYRNREDNLALVRQMNALLTELAYPRGGDSKSNYDSPKGFGSREQLVKLKTTLSGLLEQLK